MKTLRYLEDQVYSGRGGKLQYDAFLPEMESDLSAVVCIHGGGWVSGNKTDMRQVAEYFAERGFAAFCPQYRLAPLHPFPAAVEDCEDFVKHLRDNAKSFGLNPERIFSFGNSAGGHLSATLAVKNSPNQVNGAVNISGLIDLTNPQSNHPSISWDFLGQFIGKPYEDNKELWKSASPLYCVNSGSSPVMIFHGGEDDIVWQQQSERLHGELLAAGVRTEIEILPGEGHSFSVSAFERILDKSAEFFSEL